MIARCKAEVERLRVKHNIVKRTFKEVLNTDHHSDKAVTLDSPDEVIFGNNSSCILQPETIEGPYCQAFLFVLLVQFHAASDMHPRGLW